MEKRTWKLGEPCFIVDISISDLHANMRVMPAIITCLSGTKERLSASATSFSTGRLERQFIEGSPFASEKEAREWIAVYTARISSAGETAELTGMHPGWSMVEAPLVGDIVYTVDPAKREILQVAIGFVRFEFGRLEVGYDPGDPEASNVQIKEWWNTRNEAQEHVSKCYPYMQFSFVTKEELARRTKKEIETFFSDALARAQSPEFKTAISGFIETLRS